jgi:hypothetical protein
MESIQLVKPLQAYQLEVTFKNGERRLFDAKPFLERGIFGRLKDVSLFNQAYVAYDTVCWPGELDIAPETIYRRSKPVRHDSPIVSGNPESENLEYDDNK